MIPPPGLTGENEVLMGAPFKVEGLPNIRLLGTAHNVTFAVDTDEHIWAWGPSNAGQLGPGTVPSSIYYYPPVDFGYTFDSPIRQITGSIGGACALLDSGEVYCWGGQAWFGNGSAGPMLETTPQKASLANIEEIAAHQHEFAARNTGGQILHWGYAIAFPTPILTP